MDDENSILPELVPASAWDDDEDWDDDGPVYSDEDIPF